MFPSTKLFFAHRELEGFVLLRECWIENTLKRVCFSHSKSLHSIENLYRFSPRMSTVHGTIKAEPNCGSMEGDLKSQSFCASKKVRLNVPSYLLREVQIHNWCFSCHYIWYYPSLILYNKDKLKMGEKFSNNGFGFLGRLNSLKVGSFVKWESL